MQSTKPATASALPVPTRLVLTRLVLTRLVLTLLVLTLSAACAGSGWSPRRPAVPTTTPPWQIAADAYPSQHLYRVHYSGPEGDLGFKLTLYLEDRDRFRMLAVDALGRKLWVLRMVDRTQALWLNHRDNTYCWADPATGLAFVPLTRLSLDAFPRLLLGRMPGTPATDLRQEDEAISYDDDRGRTWAGTLIVGEPVRWSVIEDGEPVAWWQWVDADNRREALFSDKRGRQQVRWRQIVSEPLTTAVSPDSVPAGYRREACAATPDLTGI